SVRKSGPRHSVGLGWVCPHERRETDRTRSTIGFSRHSSSTPSPTIPVAPVTITFMVPTYLPPGEGKQVDGHSAADRDLTREWGFPSARNSSIRRGRPKDRPLD